MLTDRCCNIPEDYQSLLGIGRDYLLIFRRCCSRFIDHWGVFESLQPEIEQSWKKEAVQSSVTVSSQSTSWRREILVEHRKPTSTPNEKFNHEPPGRQPPPYGNLHLHHPLPLSLQWIIQLIAERIIAVKSRITHKPTAPVTVTRNRPTHTHTRGHGASSGSKCH